MIKRIARHAIVATALVVVAGAATAHSITRVDGPSGRADVVVLDTTLVIQGDLGEVVVVGSRRDPQLAD